MLVSRSRHNTNNTRSAVPLLLALLVLCQSATVLAAEDLIEQWYMQPRLNLDSTHNTLNTLNHQSISIGRSLNQRIDLEINLLSDSPDFRHDNQGILIDGRYYLRPQGKFAPYIAGGISSVRNFNSLDTSYQDPITNLGLGFEHTMRSSGAKIQADIRYYIDDNVADMFKNEADHDWTLSFGLSIPLTSDLFK